MKTSLLSLYDLYLEQAGQKNIEMNSYHENGHDNSGGHPNFHCNQHDNTPSRMMRLVLTKMAQINTLIKPTNECNMRCKYCFAEKYGYNDSLLDLKTLKNI